MSTLARLKGTAFASGTRMLYVGPLVATERHSHHAAQIIIASQGVDLADGANGRIRACTAVIPPHVPHGHGACEHGAILFLDGDDLVSRALSRNAEPRCEAWRRPALDVPLPPNPTPEQARGIIASVLSALDLCQPPGPRHPATRRMGAALDSSDPVDLASLSLEAGLSPRQMRHAFARDFGLPMRAYVRWKRLRRAIAAVEEGANLSAAAASAGFADSAHLTRVFREQFGMTPSQGLSSVTWRTLD
ncbi:AraC family transcriptional regulator [Myxococcus stipitatus]|uniref:helix-turn-helix domain-containing protein n=1 Tax=Myxococcus stipitatus TaxID=83455 RepID=UPI001F355C36|nr:AraC family transcriptional regulator [Myxococcus stipitatus]MCE9670762.1 AraC family transcriptional regulator [Myxococcus stipitatus]